MQKVLPYSVVKRLPRNFFKNVADVVSVDWQQPIEVIELKKVQDIYSKTDEALEGKDLTNKEVFLVYPKSNIKNFRYYRDTCYPEKLKLKFECTYLANPFNESNATLKVTNQVRVSDTGVTCSLFTEALSRVKEDLRTQNKFKKMYLLIVNRTEHVHYASTYENDVFEGIERVNPSKVKGNIYKGLQGESQQMSYRVGYIAPNEQHYDKWNFADLETCLDKSGYYFNPLTLKTRVKEYKQSKIYTPLA